MITLWIAAFALHFADWSVYHWWMLPAAVTTFMALVIEFAFWATIVDKL